MNYTHFEIKDKLAQGAFGVVYDGLAFDENGDSIPIVFKILIEDKKSLYEDECNSFIKDKVHENIVRILHCVDCMSTKDDFCKKGEAHKKRLVILEKIKYKVDEYIDDSGIETNDELFEICMDIFLQICNGVKYLHDNGYIHTDLKPENIMINTLRKNLRPGDVKIVDLGTINKIGNYKTYKIQKGVELKSDFALGTPGFKDFCQYDEKSDTKQDRRSIDIYQLGATFYDIFLDRRFQKFVDDIDTFPDRPSPYYDMFENVPYSTMNIFNKLIAEMTNKNWEKRPKIKDVITRLKGLKSESNDREPSTE